MRDQRASSVELGFSEAEMAYFAAISGDVSPLHCSHEYARKSHFGERLVYGVLAALKCIACLPASRTRVARRISLKYLHPVFVSVAYRAEVADDAERNACSVKLLDGHRVVLQAQFEFATAPDAQGGAPTVPSRQCFPRTASSELASADLAQRPRVGGRYSVDSGELFSFARELRLEDRGITFGQLQVLLWTSYASGMESPGRRGFSAATVLDFASVIPLEPFDFQLAVASFDERFGLLKQRAEVQFQSGARAAAELQAVVRDELPVDWSTLPGRTNALAGQVGVVIGGSRGLGASVAAACGVSGAKVYASYSTCDEDVESLRRAVPNVHPRRGDASDAEVCRRLAEEIYAAHGKLDFLICSATPALRPYALEPATSARFSRYVDESLRLYTAPLAALLPLLKRGGLCVLVSCASLRDFEKQWPHYAAAKAAVEALAAGLAKQHPDGWFLLAKPPRLRTHLMNLPLGRTDVLEPHVAAAAIVSAMRKPPTRPEDNFQILEAFR